jgi:replicative DNA helicase
MSSPGVPHADLRPPTDLDTERAVLSAFLLDAEFCAQEVGELLEAGHFFDERHRRIFGALRGLLDDREPVDATTVLGWLRQRGLLEAAGQTSYLVELTAAAPTVTNVQSYARRVRDLAMLRDAMKMGREMLVQAAGPVESVEELLDAFARRTNELATAGITRHVLALKDVLREVVDDTEKLSQNARRGLTGVPSGFHRLDDLTNGFQPGELVVVAARPGMGKTGLALNLLVNAASDRRRPTTGLFFSMEMSARQLVTRVWAARARVSTTQIRSGDVSELQWRALYTAVKSLRELPVFLDETSAIAVGELMRKCRQVHAEHGLGLVVVDYLQLMQASGGQKNASREQVISDISRNLKLLARELKIPVIALAQLNRSAEQRDNKRPMMSDLRESGAIEQDADIILFIYREAYYAARQKKKGRGEGDASSRGTEPPLPDVDQNQPHEVELIVAKNRSGRLDTVKLTYIPDFQMFTNQEGDSPPPPDPDELPVREARLGGVEEDFAAPPPAPDPDLAPGSGWGNAPAGRPLPEFEGFQAADYGHLEALDDDSQEPF